MEIGMEQAFVTDRIRAATAHIKKLINKKVSTITDLYIVPGDYNFSEVLDLKDINFEKFQENRSWGGKDRHYYFKCSVSGEAGIVGEPLYIQVETGANDIWNTDNPQILVYKDNKLFGTMDMNHNELMLTECLKDNDIFELIFYAYSNYSEETCFFHAKAKVISESTLELYYDIKTIMEALMLLNNDDLEKIRGLEILNKAVNITDFRNPYSLEYEKSLIKTREFLEKEYFSKNNASMVTVHSVGFTHIDVAWKWRIKQTKQKAVRSFLTVLNLMDKYPEYKFMSSTPVLYEYVKEQAPEIYERIKKRIKEGRWEAEGATWLEPDINLISGESIIRHFIYGEKFFAEELKAGKSQILWLPDVFGFSPVLPQIMQQFGVKYFVTTKTGWNDTNKFPNDTFIWRGMGDYRVLGYIVTTKNYEFFAKERDYSTTYNGLQNPSQIAGTWQRYQNKDLSRDVLTCFGYGDGGGGPTEEMLLMNRRLEKGVGGVPRTKTSTLREFFKVLEENIRGKNIQVWNGEIYLEYHRGTYTSMGRNKRNNRKSERMLLDTEILTALSGVKAENYDALMEENWKLLLLNQFHDILLGSSIKEVYEDSDKDYEKLYNSLKNIQRQIFKSKRKEKSVKGIALWNTIGFERSALYEDENLLDENLYYQKTYDNKYIHLIENISPMSFEIRESGREKKLKKENVIYNLKEEKGITSFETLYYKIKLDKFGNIISLYYKALDREIIKPGKCANNIVVYEDRPREYSAWNTEIYYSEKFWQMNELEEIKLAENGPIRGAICIRKNFVNSKFLQYICFYSHTGRIDFKTELDWYEHETLVKVHFPLDINCENVNYDIQFGNIERSNYNNTSWDRAKFEVPAHKWADISEDDFGVALLNDCKYGYGIKDSDMSLTLLKTGIFPNEEADMGRHEFVYSIFPHRGDFKRGQVIKEGYILNSNIYVEPADSASLMKYVFVEADKENIVVETIKPGYEGEGIAVRMYESFGGRCKVNLKFGGIWNIYESDMTEKQGKCLKERAKKVEITFSPYEIKTILLERGE